MRHPRPMLDLEPATHVLARTTEGIGAEHLDQRVVDDEDPRLQADPLHDAAHDHLIVRPVDAGNAEADRGRDHVALADGLLHHVVEDFFDLQFADGLQIGAARACA